MRLGKVEDVIRIAAASSIALAAGCGASASSARGSNAAACSEATQARVDELERARRDQDARIRELTARLALAHAEVNELKARRSGESVRIGTAARAERPAAEPPEPVPDVVPLEEPESPRVVLRLHGSREEASRVVPSTLPPVPPVPAGLPSRLPLAPVPGPETIATVPSDLSATPPSTSPPGSDPVEMYRAALAQVRDRQFGPARSSFQAFLKAHPRHAYAQNALYWLGEVEYAERRYREALQLFERLLEQHPRGAKASDALLKAALCHKRMGDGARAKALLVRLRQEFPDSVAAQIAAREDAL